MAMWKDVLANLEKLDERDSINSTTPPATPASLPKSVSTQTSTPVLPPKNLNTPKPSSHTPFIPSSSPLTLDTPPNISLDANNHINSFDPYDQPASISISGGDPALRRNSSPKVALFPHLSLSPN